MLLRNVQVHVFEHLLNFGFEDHLLLFQILDLGLLGCEEVVVNGVDVEFDNKKIFDYLLIFVVFESSRCSIIELLVLVTFLLASAELLLKTLLEVRDLRLAVLGELRQLA